MSTVCLIPAAGAGTRLAAGRPKAFVDLAGQTILERAVRGVLDADVDAVVVAVPADLVAQAQAMLPDCHVVVGGAERSASVRACIAAASASFDADVILIHDAARALTPPDLFRRVVDAVRAGAPAVIPGVPVTDTLKAVEPGGGAEHVVATVDRSVLRAVQTPQGFTPDALARAHAAGGHATDDAGLAEAAGIPVTVVQGDLMAFKITTEWDLRLARMLLEATGVR
ncbi:2-C-methyl-D-erythritol 4-phosphate cytidylyltransferase [Williamsia maris]|uniref:2-C-methyl-D-erythritol 4-phosphate cytidylyltransferase n=1 Tax=Williamsia maris TaxID=72806 RepID=A0ABT1HGA1_9NOCA|nr:2-C-methyl-D-erythritol 4-phosphate cytidylyltransferase [Williamsia maris]MCP2176735.1 2-C-methyl-D-erythritol 4-phosphate cytidylyltransferase [Williamsia maris]